MEKTMILEVLKWLTPIGGLIISSIATWFINRAGRELKLIRDSHDAYKTMYEDVKETLNEEIEEKRALRKALAKFERALSKVFGCRHYPNCPVSLEFRNGQTGDPKPKPRGKGRSRNKGDTSSDAGNSGGSPPDGEPP